MFNLRNTRRIYVRFLDHVVASFIVLRRIAADRRIQDYPLPRSSPQLIR